MGNINRVKVEVLIDDFDIATIEALHDLLLENGVDINQPALKNSRVLTSRMYAQLDKVRKRNMGELITFYNLDIKYLINEFKKIREGISNDAGQGLYYSICSYIYELSVESKFKEVEYTLNMMKMLNYHKPENCVSSNYWFNLDQDGFKKRIEVLDKIILSL